MSITFSMYYDLNRKMGLRQCFTIAVYSVSRIVPRMSPHLSCENISKWTFQLLIWNILATTLPLLFITNTGCYIYLAWGISFGKPTSNGLYLWFSTFRDISVIFSLSVCLPASVSDCLMHLIVRFGGQYIIRFTWKVNICYRHGKKCLQAKCYIA